MLAEAKAATNVDGTGAVTSKRYAWYAVFILVIAYTMSYVDRTILTLMVDPIRKSLQIGDFQISLLHGLAFAIFYTILGLPIGRLVDIRKRTTIITVGILSWSLMTMLCGVARNFSQLFLARVGVGIGEASLGPAAYSMLSDYFEDKKDLTRAVSVYTGAIYIGAGIAMIAGGALIGIVPALEMPGFGHFEPWQVVFLLVGLPGFFVALLVALLREPPRRGLMKDVAVPSLTNVADYIVARRKAYGLLIAGFSASALMWNGVSTWIPTFFIRTFAWSPADVGLWFGLSLLAFGTSGIIFGGLASGWIRDRGHTDANLRIGVISACASLITGVAAPLMPSGGLSMMMFCLFIFSASMPYGGAGAALQEITPNQMRGQVSAIWFFAINLCGIGLGPTIVATFTDYVFGNDGDIRYSLVVTVILAAPVSAGLLVRACSHYRSAVARNDF